MKQERIEHSSKRVEEEDIEVVATPSVKKAEFDDNIDDILDEIDGVLEKDSATFVKSFIQKGGE